MDTAPNPRRGFGVWTPTSCGPSRIEGKRPRFTGESSGSGTRWFGPESLWSVMCGVW